MNTLRVALLCSILVPWTASAVDLGLRCEEDRKVDAVEYWFWEAYTGITDPSEESGQVTVRLIASPDICIRVGRVELEDSGARTLGYKRAILEWAKRLPRKESEWNEWGESTDALSMRRTLKRLTGRDFESPEVWARWWKENADYIVWSDSDDSLVLDADAKKRGQKLAEVVQGIDAATYWYFNARERIKDQRIDNDVLKGKAWSPPHGYFEFAIETSKLGDRTAKEQGYRRAVKSYILDGVALPELKGDALQRTIAALQRLTGLSLTDRDQWVRWWHENQDRLYLSKNSEQLTVRSE